ncbi:MAG: hypothetical protein ACE5JI_11430 [Acidobacteriota bacterium]
MPTLILEDSELESLRSQVPDVEVVRAGSDDRWPSRTSRPVNEHWFFDEEERRAYLCSLLALLD